MNPTTNKFEPLHEQEPDRNTDGEAQRRLKQRVKKIDPALLGVLLRPNGEPVPDHWIQFQVGEQVVVKGYTFKVAYIGESTLLLEPVGPVIVGEV